MVRLSRRGLLATTGTASISFAGCTGIFRQFDDPPQLGELMAQNWQPSSRAVQVLVTEEGEPVYWVATRLSPGREEQPEDHVFEGYPTEPGEYVLYVKVDDQPRSNWHRLDFSEYDTSCLGVVIDIGREDADELVDILVSTDPDICEDESSPT